MNYSKKFSLGVPRQLSFNSSQGEGSFDRSITRSMSPSFPNPRGAFLSKSGLKVNKVGL